MINDKYDAMVVLGKNIGVGWTRNKIRKTTHFLSDRAEFSVMAGGVLFQTGNFGKIIFSAGKTAGRDYPSEAEAMSNFLLLKFPDIPEDKVILEDVSRDTLENAKEVKKVLEKYSLKKIMVLTTPEHVKRSRMLFRKAGIDAEVTGSDGVLKTLAPEIYREYKYKTNPLEILFEKTAYVIQSVPLMSFLAHMIVKKTRAKD